MRYKDKASIISDNLSQFRRVCKCGRHCTVAPVGRDEYINCTWCNGRLYRDIQKQKAWDAKCEKEEFRFKFAQYIKKANA